MNKLTGFLDIERAEQNYHPPEERTKNFQEFVVPLTEPQLREQATRCMDCGIPYCHTGCPINNQIPDWNDLVGKGNWREALDDLHMTNNFPEFTGRVCPAPCEAACTLNIVDAPVTIKSIECALVDRGWKEGWIKPQVSMTPSGKSVAIIGSGPAGLTAAQQLARAGHEVHLYEKNHKPGGLLRYGIPDFKMEKHLIDRRIDQMRTEGVIFHTDTNVGSDVDPHELCDQHGALILAGGAEVPRDLPVPGRTLDGVCFAMRFLAQQNRRTGQEPIEDTPISAEGKHVVVIGGGDTGSDCIGTSFRQGARSVTQLEIMPQPPEHENKALTWPDWPLKMRTSSSQAEGAIRDFSIMTRAIKGENGKARAIECVHVGPNMNALEGSEFELSAELILLAMGFVHPMNDILETLQITTDAHGNIVANTTDYLSSQPKIFACGDMRRGQSLVVWAIREGRQAARAVDLFLMEKTTLS